MSDATDVVKREACCVRAGQLKERVGRRASSGLGGLGWAGRRSGKRADEASDVCESEYFRVLRCGPEYRAVFSHVAAGGEVRVLY